CYAYPPALHSFPTRRSSDLKLTSHQLAFRLPSPSLLPYRRIGVVCRACSAARRCKSSTQPDGGEGLATTQGLSPRNLPQRSRLGDRKSTRLNSSHLVISYAV